MTVNLAKDPQIQLTRDAAIAIAKRRVRLMRQSDGALRAGEEKLAYRLDVEAARAEVTLIRAGYKNFV